MDVTNYSDLDRPQVLDHGRHAVPGPGQHLLPLHRRHKLAVDAVLLEAQPGGQVLSGGEGGRQIHHVRVHAGEVGLHVHAVVGKVHLVLEDGAVGAV